MHDTEASSWTAAADDDDNRPGNALEHTRTAAAANPRQHPVYIINPINLQHIHKLYTQV